jgi:hypothetical protein
LRDVQTMKIIIAISVIAAILIVAARAARDDA